MKSLKITGLCGIIGPVIAFIFIFLAISYAPWFSWADNWLSDLGGFPGETPIWAARGTPSMLLNFGLMLAGIFGIIFASGFRRFLLNKRIKPKLAEDASFLLIVDMIALFCTGLFPEAIGYPHTIASVLFFLLVPISLLFIGFLLMKERLGMFSILLVIISLIIFPLFFVSRPVGANAIIEASFAVIMSVFTIIAGAKLFLYGKSK